MNIKRNTFARTLTIAAGAMLVVSLPAGAQVLGGGLTGAASGMLGGDLGASGIHGTASGTGNGAFGATDSFGTLRDRAGQGAARTRDVAGSTAAGAGSRAESARGATSATAQTAHSAGVNASRQAADTGQGASTAKPVETAKPGEAAPQPGSNLLLGGSAAAEKHAMGHSASAHGAANSQTSANRDGVLNNSNGDAGINLSKDEPAPAETPAQ